MLLSIWKIISTYEKQVLVFNIYGNFVHFNEIKKCQPKQPAIQPVEGPFLRPSAARAIQIRPSAGKEDYEFLIKG